MKHGDKAKGKASKASGKKASKASASGKARAAETKGKQAAPKTVPKASATDGKGKVRPTGEGPHFSNPIVGAAFKRAIKKFPNAFRRLTD